MPARGMTDRIYDRMVNAIVMLEKGKSIPEIAKFFGVNPMCIRTQFHAWICLHAALRIDMLDDPELLNSINQEIELIQNKLGPKWGSHPIVESATKEELAAIKDESQPLPERIKEQFFPYRQHLSDNFAKRLI